MLFGSSDSPLADQRSVMVAETGLKWQDNPGQRYVQSSPLLLVLLSSLCAVRCNCLHLGAKCPAHPFAGSWEVGRIAIM
jgi:hypothetical protein